MIEFVMWRCVLEFHSEGDTRKSQSWGGFKQSPGESSGKSSGVKANAEARRAQRASQELRRVIPTYCEEWGVSSSGERSSTLYQLVQSMEGWEGREVHLLSPPPPLLPLPPPPSTPPPPLPLLHVTIGNLLLQSPPPQCKSQLLHKCAGTNNLSFLPWLLAEGRVMWPFQFTSGVKITDADKCELNQLCRSASSDASGWKRTGGCDKVARERRGRKRGSFQRQTRFRGMKRRVEIQKNPRGQTLRQLRRLEMFGLCGVEDGAGGMRGALPHHLREP